MPLTEIWNAVEEHLGTEMESIIHVIHPANVDFEVLIRPTVQSAT